MRVAERWRIEVHDLPKLRSALGDDLLIAFARAFAGADRLMTIHQLLKNVNDAGKGTVRHERDAVNLIILAWAHMRELSDTAVSLIIAGVEGALIDKTALARLREMGGRWKGSGFQEQIRNGIGFHFDPKLCLRGLEAWTREPPKDRRLTLVWGQGKRPGDASFPFGTQLMFEGAGMNPAQLVEFGIERMGDHIDFANTVEAIFLDVVHFKTGTDVRYVSVAPHRFKVIRNDPSGQWEVYWESPPIRGTSIEFGRLAWGGVPEATDMIGLAAHPEAEEDRDLLHRVAEASGFTVRDPRREAK